MDFPRVILCLSLLSSLALANNDFTTTFPDDVISLEALKRSFGSSYALSSWIGDPCNSNWAGITCSTLHSFQRVTSMDLSFFDLEGTIDFQIGDLTGLQFLSLANNRLTGSIPSSIGQLTLLRHLHLENNLLSGTVPEEVGELLDLHSLTIGDNALSGSVPESVKILPRLIYFDSSRMSSKTPKPNPGVLTSLYKILFADQSTMDSSDIDERAQPRFLVGEAPSSQPTGEPIAQPSPPPPPVAAEPPQSPPITAPPPSTPADPSPPPPSPPPPAIAPAPSSPPPAVSPPPPSPPVVAPQPSPSASPPPTAPPPIPAPVPPAPVPISAPPPPQDAVPPQSSPPIVDAPPPTPAAVPPPPVAVSPPAPAGEPPNPPSSPASPPIPPGAAFPPPPPVCLSVCLTGQIIRSSDCNCTYPLFVNFKLDMQFAAFTLSVKTTFLSEVATNLNTTVASVLLISANPGSVLANLAILPIAPATKLTSAFVTKVNNILTGSNDATPLTFSSVFGTVSVLNITNPVYYLGQLSPPPPQAPPPSSSKISTAVIIGIAAGVGVLVFLLLIVCCLIYFCCCSPKKPRPVPDAVKDYTPPRVETSGWAQAPSRTTSSPGSGRKEPSSATPLISKREARDAPAGTSISSALSFNSPVSQTPPPRDSSPVSAGAAAAAAALVAVGTTKKQESSPRTRGPVIGAQAFTVADLQVATKSFSYENLVGEGPMGSLYRADFAQSRALAIKQVRPSAVDGMSDEDFKGLVSNMARLRHPNIVELHGYCLQYGQRLLAFQYFPEGNLFDFLHDPKRQPYLTWDARVKIAVGCARGLEYLHEHITPPIVHRKFKSTNVQLDRELNAHVADGGMAVFNPIGVDTMSQGGYTYSAPEYTMSGVYTIASDVYSYGVVLLELLTGRQPIDLNRPKSEQSLVRWATPMLSDFASLEDMLDPSLPGDRPDAVYLARFAEIITRCLQYEAELRPSMSKVGHDLVKKLTGASGKFSEVE